MARVPPSLGPAGLAAAAAVSLAVASRGAGAPVVEQAGDLVAYGGCGASLVT